MLLLGLVICCVAFFEVESLDLPESITKCCLSDPYLNDCIKENANAIIPLLTKGDAALGLKPVSPFVTPKMLANWEDLSFTVENASLYGIENLKIIDVGFNLEEGKCKFTAYVDKVTGKGDNSTLSGYLLNIPVSGYGRYNSTMTKVKINVDINLATYMKESELYMDTSDRTINVDLGSYLAHFEHIESPEESDVNAYIKRNEAEMTEKAIPLAHRFFGGILFYVIDEISAKVPLNKIFTS